MEIFLGFLHSELLVASKRVGELLNSYICRSGCGMHTCSTKELFWISEYY